jgi:hypothetical protein
VLAGARVGLVEMMQPHVGRAAQDSIDIGGMEHLAAISIAAFIEPRDDLLGPHRTGLAIALQVKIEDLAYDRRFALIDRQLLLVLVAAAFNDHGLIPQRRSCDIPEAVAGIGCHRAADVLGIFLALVFVELIEDRADEIGHMTFTHILGD